MPKILITGNGFDLFHGLPTKYGHFMKIVDILIQSSLDSDRINFKQVFNEDFQSRYAEDYKKITEMYDLEKIFFEASYLIKLSELSNNNLWFRYFCLHQQDFTWIDFEEKISNVLENYSFIFNQQRKKRYSKIDGAAVGARFSINESIGLGFGELRQDKLFLIEDYLDNKTSCIDEKKILTKLSESLNDFKQIFDMYLNHIVCKFYEHYKGELIQGLDGIESFYTFNYTPTIEKLYKIHSSKIIYLHGRISNNETSSTIILGVNEVDDIIKNNAFYDFSKYYQKILNTSNYGFVKPLENNSHYNPPLEIYLIGHSLDKSDKYFIDEIFYYLNFDSTKKSYFNIFIIDENDKKQKLRNLFSNVKEKNLIELNRENRVVFLEMSYEKLLIEFSDILSSNPFFR